MESLGLACDFRHTIRAVTEVKNEETMKQPHIHHVCGKAHKKGSCDVVCKGCGMKGSHKVDKCWKIHPELKPRNMMNGKEERDRGINREKFMSRSRDKEGEGNKRGRKKNPYQDIR